MTLLSIQACASTPDLTQACLEVKASPRLNLYGGYPHAVTMYLYPLKGRRGFGPSNTDQLLEGAMPSGANGPRVPITFSPGETQSLEETFQPATAYVGIIVDYYRAPGDPEGTRMVVVEAKCGRGRPTVALLPRDVLLN